MNDLIITAYAASNVGKRRLNNEDNYYINGQIVHSENDIHSDLFIGKSFLGAVCDGMGGEEFGEVASQITVETIKEFESSLVLENFSDDVINKLVITANDRVCEKITQEKKRMGTTITLIGINGDTATLSNIGDSRIYKFSDNVLTQVSYDHTEAQTMVDTCILTKEESMKVKEKHRLTQHIGIFPYEMIIEPYTVRLKIKLGDRYLLCSDGLTDMLSEYEILSVLQKNLTIQETCDMLITQALEKGGKDNVTVLLCDIRSKSNIESKNINAIANYSSGKLKDNLLTSINVNTSDKKTIVLLKKLIVVLLAIILVLSLFICVKETKLFKHEKSASEESSSYLEELEDQTNNV